MNHSYDYPFKDRKGKRSKPPYRPKKIHSAQLPPIEDIIERYEQPEVEETEKPFDFSETFKQPKLLEKRTNVFFHSNVQKPRKLRSLSDVPKKKEVPIHPHIAVEEWVRSGKSVPGIGPRSPLQSRERRRSLISIDSISQLPVKNNRLPYLKDIILQGKQPSNKLLQETSQIVKIEKKRQIGAVVNTKESQQKKTKVAPDDEEEISKLRTGEDAVAFFSTIKKDSAAKFVYLNRADQQDEFRPYDLVVVKKEEVNPSEYFIMSSSGVTHLQEGQPTEFISLPGWMRESTLFNVLRRIRFFKYYLVYKMFKIWHMNARYKKYCKIRAKLSKRFFIAKKTFATTLQNIHKMCYDLQSVGLMTFAQTNDMKKDSSFLIENFYVMQEKQRQTAAKEFETKMEAIESTLVKLCDSVTSRSRVPDMNSPDTIEAYLMGNSDLMQTDAPILPNKKSKSMVEEQKEERRKQLALKKAKEEADMLGDFVRVADYMAVESLIVLAKDSLKQFKEALGQKTVTFLVKLLFKGENEIIFEPNESGIMVIFQKNSKEIAAICGQVERLLYMRSFKLYFEKVEEKSPTKISFEEEKREEQWNVQDVILQDEEFNQTANDIYDSLKRDFAKAIEYGRTFEGLKTWYQFGQGWKEEEYVNKQHGVAEFTNDILKVNEALSILERIKLSNEIGMLFVDSRGLRQVLLPLMTSILEQIKSQISTTCRELCTQLLKDFTDRVRIMQERPNKLKDFAAFVAQLDAIKEYSRVLMVQADDVEKMYELALKNKVPFTTQDSVQVDQLKDVREKFLESIREAEEFKQNNIGQRRHELNEAIQTINTELLNTMAVLRTGKFVTAESDPAEVLKELEVLNQQIQQMKSKIEVYKEYQRLFSFHGTEWTNLKEVEKQFQLRLDIWTILDSIERKTEQWENTDIDKLDVEIVNKEVEEFHQKSYKLARACKNEVTALMRKKIAEWKARMPVITMIGNKDLKLNHWQEIFRRMNVNAKGSTYTLRQLANMRIFMYKDLVTEVSTRASGEADLLKMLDKIDKGWRDTEFIVQPYRGRKDAFRLGPVDEIIQHLEDDQVTLQTMQASLYIVGVKHKVEEWERRLANLSEILEEWLLCQKNWMYLEFIFSSEDIKRQLHEEAAKFREVDRIFREKMQNTNQVKNVIKATSEESLLQTFKDCNKTLDEIQKSLEDFLETKREFFPRFYFLSNDELLEILSQTREPRAVQPHLSKCFDNMKRLEFKDDESNEIIAMVSSEGEQVELIQPLPAQGNVEFWLGDLEKMMRLTIHEVMKECIKAYGETVREDWFFEFPAQAITTVDQIVWTAKVTEALEAMEKGKNKNALQEYVDIYIKQIEKMVELVRRTDLNKLQRRTVNCLIILDVHARDVMQKMIEDKVSSPSDFQWTMQLRYYWEDSIDDCTVKQANASFLYGYEYLGNQSRLVITPLTDRCYLTCTGALNLFLGGSPQGPAGTGKTETVKDLAKALARQCVVFNCSEGLKVNMMSRMFSGLAQAGALACFDEFNRIDIEVLSVVAQYMRIIQKAIVTKASHFIFDGRDIKLNPSYGVFITMNPGYAGRTELPDNLKALFRPVAMMIPDYALIAEIMLYSEGFDTAKVLSRKMVQLFKLSSEQLSKQDHYDFGMRAVKSILVRAGALKRGEPELREDIVLIRAMRDSNVPKFLKRDVDLFMAIIRDLFPEVVIPDVDVGYLQNAIEHQLSINKYQVVGSFVKKIIQLYETMSVRHGVMLVGSTGTGKTVSYQILKKALTELHKKERDSKNKTYLPVNTYVINPKSVTMGELYGQINEMTHEFVDGLVAKTAREIVKSKGGERHWMVFDGPVDALWIENMNTVLDDNKMLCLVNGERIKLPNTVSLLFEVQDLKVASPATVSRCGMVYMEPSDLNGVWMPITKSWAIEFEKKFHGKSKRILELVNDFVGPTLHFLRKECTELIPSVDFNLVSSLLSLLDALLVPEYGVKIQEEPKKQTPPPIIEIEEENRDDLLQDDFEVQLEEEEKKEVETEKVEEKEEELNTDKLIDLYFIFAYIWSLGGNLSDESRPLFDMFARGLITTVVPDFPKDGLVYDYYVNYEKQQFEKWIDIVPEFHYDPKKPFSDILVPTADTTCYQYLMKAILSVNKHFLLTGASGVGKTVIIQEFLREQLRTEEPSSSYTSMFANLSAQTTSKNLQELIQSKLESKRRNLLGAPSGKKAIAVIDDLNMPKLEEYGAQPPIELLRQTIDQKGFYDLEKLFFIRVQDLVFISACAPPGGGRNEVTPRLIRHFHLLNLPSLSTTSLQKIFDSIFHGYLSNGFSDDVIQLSSKMVRASISMYEQIKKELLPRPSTSHYTFNLRDLSKLFQGICQITPSTKVTPQYLMELWCHEGARVFRDRLINEKDRNWFTALQQIILKTTFQLQLEPEQINNIMFGDFLDRDEKVYQKIEDFEQLPSLLTEYLTDYNVEKGQDLNIVFFRDAIEHLARISRIIRQPRGCALLVGVGGSGRQSLTKLAAYMAGYKCVTVEVKRNFNLNLFREAIKEFLLEAGCEDKNIVFLFSDRQITDESFLEDINNILNTGEVPNMFTVEDMEKILNAVRPQVKKLGKLETRDVIYKHFVSLVRKNFHVVLCMSPIGDAFRNRIRMFPSLVNYCTIDWYHKWPDEALFSVAKNHLENVEILKNENLLENVCHLCVQIHKSVTEYSEKFLKELRRHNYVTPTSYLELLTLYHSMLEDQKMTIMKKLDRLSGGLNRLESTNKAVNEMQIELKNMQPILQQAIKDTEALSKQLAIDKQKAQEKREECAKDERACKVITDEATKIRDECAADLAEAMPIFERALAAVQAINKNDIYVIKAFKNPPDMVKMVMDAVCILFNIKDPKWDDSLKLLTDANFLKNLENFDRDNVPPVVLRRLKKYTSMPEFNPKLVESSSSAAKSLCMWVLAVEKYSEVSAKVKPKQEKLKAAEEKLKAAQAQLEEKQAILREIEENVAQLQRQFDDAEFKQKTLRQEVKTTEERLVRAAQLLGGLSDERVRWSDASKELEADLKNLVGNILLAAGCIAYLGPFNQSYRQEMLELWKEHSKELKIPVGSDFSLLKIVEPIVIREWILNGLPTDDFSAENAILVTKGRRWPLMIDPQGQANTWIKNTEKEAGLKIIKANETDMMRKLEAAIRVGIPALIENVGEELDPSLEPVLLKKIHRAGGRMLIRLGDQDVDYNPNFRLYMTTKLANPHYMPEVCTKVAIINFTVILKGLEDQLLADVVKHEKPNLEKQKDTLMTQIADGKNQLKATEDKILNLLSKPSELNILDDFELIAALKDSKAVAEKISAGVKQTEETAKEIEQAREKYRPVATRGSIIYFVIADMSLIDPMYQYSLAFFKNLFKMCLEKSKKSNDLEKRLRYIIDYTTETSYQIICRGLFEQHKRLFSFLLTVQILRHQGTISDKEWNYFLRGGGDLTTTTQSPYDWIGKDLWLSLNALSTLDGFEDLLQSIEKDNALWKEYYESENPTKEPLPEPWNQVLSQWRKLLILKTFRPEKVILAIHDIISTYLGPRFTESPPFHLEGTFADSNNRTPIIFILSSGADPQSLFERFAQEKGFAQKTSALALGQGQGVKAKRMIEQAKQQGEWVFLQNCHLAISWLPELEKIVEQLSTDSEQIHKDFRLWLTSMPTKDFPVPILQSSIKLTNEPPQGLKANLKRCFNDIDKKTYEKTIKEREWKKLLFGLIFFHALIQERKKYGSLGWNISYEWRTSDLEASIKSLYLYLQENDNVPWNALRYIIGTIHYGGRVTDFLDLRCIESILKKFFRPEILTENYKFTENGIYYAPKVGTLSDTKLYIESLPNIEKEEPDIFGLHKNANIAYQQKETQALLDAIISIQPRTTSSGTGKSNDEIVSGIASDFLERVPEKLDPSKAHPSTFAMTEKGVINSLGTFLSQEIENFNVLLDVIKTSLINLKKAIEGAVLMSTELEKMYDCFLYQKVPELWANAAYPSLKPLRAWFEDLCERVKFTREWLENGPPVCFWFSSFFFPQGFITGVLQAHARRFTIPIDTLRLKTIVLTPEEEANVKHPPDVGVYIKGLYLEGASWDAEKRCLIECGRELHTKMPMIWLKPEDRNNFKEIDAKCYSCPVYKTSARAGTLSTTGLSTNFVLSIDLDPGTKDIDHWIQRGTALLCMKD